MKRILLTAAVLTLFGFNSFANVGIMSEDGLFAQVTDRKGELTLTSIDGAEVPYRFDQNNIHFVKLSNYEWHKQPLKALSLGKKLSLTINSSKFDFHIPVLLFKSLSDFKASSLDSGQNVNILAAVASKESVEKTVGEKFVDCYMPDALDGKNLGMNVPAQRGVGKVYASVETTTWVERLKVKIGTKDNYIELTTAAYKNSEDKILNSHSACEATIVPQYRGRL